MSRIVSDNEKCVGCLACVVTCMDHHYAGDAAIVRTPLGEKRFTVFADIGVKPGVVHIYHDDPGGNINSLLRDDWCDPISGFPGFRSSLCAVERAEKSLEVDSL